MRNNFDSAAALLAEGADVLYCDYEVGTVLKMLMEIAKRQPGRIRMSKTNAKARRLLAISLRAWW